MKPRGWCPSIYLPMPSGDGLIVRVKPRGPLTRAQAHLVADIAATHGNGAIDLTSGANLQLRGFTETSVPVARAMLIDAGLVNADGGAEARRNLILPPLAGSVAGAIARALEKGLANATLAGLPGKFSFLVDDGSAPGLGGIRADIAIRLGPPCLVVLDGDALGIPCAPADAAGLALSLAHAFLAHAFLATGAARMARAERRKLATPTLKLPRAHDGAAVGRIGADAVGIAPEFGRLTAPDLRALADLAGQFGDGLLRVAAQRVLVIAGVAEPEALLAAAAALGCVTRADDPRLRIIACPGAPDCAAASVAVREDARALAVALKPGTSRIHISGCPKGCAHPAAAALVFAGVDGHYNAVRNGRAADPPFATGLAHPDPDLVTA